MKRFNSYYNKSLLSGNDLLKVITFSLFLLAGNLIPAVAQSEQSDYETSDSRSIIDLTTTDNVLTANHEEAPYVAMNLLKRGEGTRFYTGNPKGWNEQAYIQINSIKGDGLDLYDESGNLVTDHIIVYVRRAELRDPSQLPEGEELDSFGDAQPTIFRMAGLFEGASENDVNSWQDLGYIYLLYRGPFTKEYSARMAIKKLWMDLSAENAYDHTPEGEENKGPNDVINGKKDVWNDAAFNNDGTPKKLVKLRFYVEANNNREAAENIYEDDNYGYRAMVMSRFDVVRIGPNDPYTLDENGFIDRLHLKKDYNLTLKDYNFVNTTGIATTDISNPNYIEGWSDNISGLQEQLNNVIYDLDEKGNKIQKITLPSFDFITSDNQDDDDKLDSGQKRQPTHTVEHIIYAIPGDVVPLYPYYNLSSNFDDKFVHWYDYKTGGSLKYTAGWSEIEYDLLDFAVDPSTIYKSDKFGFFGFYTGRSNVAGVTNLDSERKKSSVATFFCPRNPYIPAGRQNRLFENQDLDEYVIAADFSQTITDAHIGTNEIIEPIINVRHLFRIRDGIQFAEELSGSKEANDNFIRKNQRMVSARAGAPFQIRFDTPVPVDGTTRSNYYYKISDMDYRRVCSMSIRVLDSNRELLGSIDYNSTEKIWNYNKEKLDCPEFEMSEEFDGYGSRIIEDREYFLCGGNGQYFRMLKLDKPAAGNYIVQLIGRDVNGDEITIFGSKDPLVVMEYNITFLPPSKASMLTQETMYASDDFKHTRSEVLGTPQFSIDFDEYFEINKLEGNDELKAKLISNQLFSSSTANQSEFQWTYFKWPIDWSLSNYSFGYDNRRDYNMYQLATNSQNTLYAVAANLQTEGTYDCLYYETKRKNEQDETVPIQQGYFYYLNAATDPGVAARLRVEDLCPGSTIQVSAWMSEFSQTTETANLSFNFVAVLNDQVESTESETSTLQEGDRIVLHSFITGYVPSGANSGKLSDGDESDARGKWLNIYYSFVPRLSEFASEGITSDMVDHYELELDNNCKNSGGADYAIDDIRVYLVKPQMYADQLTPICNEERATDVKVESSFDTLLQAVGEQEATPTSVPEDIKIYYTFLDKEKYDKEIQKPDATVEDAFNASVLTFPAAGEENDGKKYGSLQFSTRFKDNELSTENATDNSAENVAHNSAYGEEKDGVKCIVFNAQLTDDNLRPGKKYYVVMVVKDRDNTQTPESQGVSQFFDMANPCGIISEFTVKSANLVKIDGIPVEDYDKITVCENQSPVVQVSLYGKNKDEFEVIEENALFDWFNGSVYDFYHYSLDSDTENTLDMALGVFREKYPHAESLDEIPVPEDNAGNTEVNDEQSFELWMYELLKQAVSPHGEPGNWTTPILQLAQTSYVFPPTQFEEGETEREYKVVAIPIMPDMTENEDDNSSYLYCSVPTEINIKALNKSPKLRHGFADIDYKHIEDVPLRIGLDQLNKVITDKVKNDQTQKGKLFIPIHDIAFAGEQGDNPKSLRLRDKDNTVNASQNWGTDIILVQTNDPDYQDLGVYDETNKIQKFPVVGEMRSLIATENGSENVFSAQFYSDFNFKEGYYYSLRFEYEENGTQDKTICPGQDVFTIKVVPKYQMWTGIDGANWNNDANWRRVSSEELLSSTTGKEDYVTDDNGNSRSYAPLDFTKVIIPAGSVYPQLAEIKHSRTSSDSGLKEVYDGKEKTSYKWDYSHPLAFDPTGNDEISGIEDDETVVNPATDLIQYDMVYHTYDADDDVYCRLWYANTADEVHFNTNAQILNQQYLDYNKAWVDMEMKPGRWYTAAMPLQSVVAGDMYLPSANARQETELFQDIKYDNTLNNRYAPAVYQRGWDKGSETVYELPEPSGSTSSDMKRAVAVGMNWSHVYNDVAEAYTPGMGFSIKTDVNRLESFDSENDNVKFRFPKADTDYLYFDDNSNDGSKPNEKSFDRTKSGKLVSIVNGKYEVTLKNANSGNTLFLVGNPFMAHLDMEKFIKENEDVINPKYWIMTENSQNSAILDETSGGFIGNNTTEVDADYGSVAPLQGFFVEKKGTGTAANAEAESGETLTLKFTPEMMTLVADNAGDEDRKPMLKSATRSSFVPDVVISNSESAAIIIADVNADEGYNPEEDVQLLDEPMHYNISRVYTTAGNMASVINRTSGLEGIEVGILAPEGVENTLLFEGDALEGYFLYDLATGDMTPLEWGVEKTVTGPVSGRLFLTRGSNVVQIESDAIKITGSNGTVTVTAPAVCGEMNVRIYDTVGRWMAGAAGEDEVSVYVGSGIYIVEVTASNGARNHMKLKI